MERLRPSRKWSVRNTELKNTRILYIDSSNRLLSTMPSKRTSNDVDLIEPTQYRVNLNLKQKNPPRAVASTCFQPLHINDFNDHGKPNLRSGVKQSNPFAIFS